MNCPEQIFKFGMPAIEEYLYRTFLIKTFNMQHLYFCGSYVYYGCIKEPKNFEKIIEKKFGEILAVECEWGLEKNDGCWFAYKNGIVKKKFVLTVSNIFCTEYFEDFVLSNLDMSILNSGPDTTSYVSDKKPKDFDKKIIKKFGTVLIDSGEMTYEYKEVE